jgi:hypothetical protein
MTRFTEGWRVIVQAAGHPLGGVSGTVRRILRGIPTEAWVRMDSPIPDEMARFPVGDDRRNDALLDAEDCELLDAPESPR